jgi:hypothetical protein
MVVIGELAAQDAHFPWACEFGFFYLFARRLAPRPHRGF